MNKQRVRSEPREGNEMNGVGWGRGRGRGRGGNGVREGSVVESTGC